MHLLLQWQELRRLGNPVNAEQICANAPELHEPLKQQIAALELAERVLGAKLTIDGMDPAVATVDHNPTSGDFDQVQATTPQQVVIQGCRDSPLGYEVLSELGRGGMGVVYKALQVKAKRIVALKMILSGVHASPAALERFRIEGESVARLQHPNIVQVFDVGDHNGTPYFALEFCEGGTLASKLAGTPLTAKDAAILVEKLARAVGEAHEKGIIHRDLKPANVLLTASGEPKVTDFGLAKQVEPLSKSDSLAPREVQHHPLAEREDYGSPLAPREASTTPHLPFAEYAEVDSRSPLAPQEASTTLPLPLAEYAEESPPFAEHEASTTPPVPREELTQTGAVMGTPSYMAPEQALGEAKHVGPPCDVYALGSVLYECLTGRPPFKSTSFLETLDQVRNQEPVPPSQLNAKTPRDLETICLRCLRKEPGKRYTSANAFADDLRRFLEGRPIVARPVGRLERAVKWVKRNPAITGSTLTVFLALAIGATVSYSNYRNAESARKAEANQVKQRDIALAKADEAIKEEAERVKERDYQLGIGNMLLAVAAYDNRDMKLARERLANVPDGQRKFEWHFLGRKTQGGIFTLNGHMSWVTSVSYSPDGARILTGSYDNTAKVWDARTGTPLIELKGLNEAVISVSFSPDGTRIVTGCEDGIVKVWDARTGTPLVELKGHTNGVTSVSFSRDGGQIATGSHDRTAKVWDARTGEPLVDLTGHTQKVMCVSFSPDGTRIATASGDQTAKVWDARTGSALVTLAKQDNWITSVGFSPDGTRIATGSYDGTAKVWDARTGTLLVKLNEPARGVSSLNFSPDGARIVTGGFDGTAKVWEARTGTLLAELRGHADEVTSVHFSPDGSRIVTGSKDETAKVWDARTGIPVVMIPGRKSASFSPDGTRIVTASFNGTAKVWDTRTGTLLLNLVAGLFSVESVNFSMDGRRIVTGSFDGTAKVWDAQTGAPLVNLKGHTDPIWSISFSSDGSRIVTGSADRKARVWNSRTGTPIVDLKEHISWIRGVSFSPDGTQVFTGTQNGMARLWDARTGVLQIELDGHKAGVTSGAYSPDGTRIVTGSDDKTAKVWDARTGTLLHDLKGHSNWVSSVSFSHDGTRIITGSTDKTAKVWDARTGTPLLDLKGHSDEVASVCFSPDGSRILTSSEDKTVRVWDARTGHELTGNSPTDEWEHRLYWTRPRPVLHREEFDKASKDKDTFAASFHLDRLLAYQPQERPSLLAERIRLQKSDLPVLARTTVHSPALAKPQAAALFVLSTRWDPLSMRLLGGLLIRAGKPLEAIAPLKVALGMRGRDRPPVEELLLALAYRDAKQPEQAATWHDKAAAWLDHYRLPLATILGSGYPGTAQIAKSQLDPRYNPFEWESWHECEVFRAEWQTRLK